jgi:DNA-binding transcriptional LysR family regulator
MLARMSSRVISQTILFRLIFIYMNLVDHLEKLKYFYEVAKEGSLKKASETVFISQPSLTKSIKILEDVVGNPLFIRMPRGMKLTKEGEVLYSYCHQLFASISDMEQRIVNPDDPLAGSLRIGTYESISIYFWPKFLQSFLTKHKKLNIELTTGRSHEMQQKLYAGELDLILIVDPKDSQNIKVEPLHTDSFKLYQSTKKTKVYDEFDEAPIIAMPTAAAGTQSIRDLLHKTGLEDRKIYSTSSLESAKELTLHGIGLGLLPEMVVKSAIQAKKITEVKLKGFPKQGIGQHSIGIAYHAYRKDSAIIKELIKAIKKYDF